MSLRETWQILSDPTRLRLIALLRQEELSVAELQEILHLGQSRISTHLSVLRNANLVRPRREGKHTFYSIASGLSKELSEILNAAQLSLGELPEATQDAEALRVILEKRRSASRDYFNRIAGRLGKSFCPGRGWAEIGPLLAQLIPRTAVVADLGAGEGWLSQLLAETAAQVIAVDLSPKMVEFGKTEARKKKLPNLEYRKGDLESPPIDSGTVDYVIISQALHHAVKPAEAIKAAARLLKPNGRLVILDLNQHNFDKARELYSDTWLGFSEVDLLTWLKDAGLTNVNVQLLAPEAEAPYLQPVLATADKPV